MGSIENSLATSEDPDPWEKVIEPLRAALLKTVEEA